MASSDKSDRVRRLFRDLSEHGLSQAKGDPGQSPPAPGRPLPELFSNGRYELQGVLGEGASAVVYRGWDRELKRIVAIKVLRDVMTSGEIARERFRREARATANLSHPNLIKVFDTGHWNGQAYLVMELVEGQLLGNLLAARTAQRRDLLKIVEKAARGVAAAHAKGIIHRDLKPGNVIVTPEGESKVGDFGLVHLAGSTVELTRTGTALGTPLYMSPEQVEGRVADVSPRTDVYALGAILYEIVAGVPPHRGETVAEIFEKILHHEPVALRKRDKSISRDLETIILKSLEKEPARRYSNAEALADDLQRHLAGDSIEARPAGIVDLVYRKIRRNPLAAVLAAGAVAIAVVALAAWVSSIRGAQRAEYNRTVARDTIRSAARISLDAALGFRRLGANERMNQSVPPLKEAYRQAAELAPDLAEVDYLLGRMYRALMEYDEALVLQERALRKDSAFVPALYERVVLVLRKYDKKIWENQRGVGASVTQGNEGANPELAPIRDQLIRDCDVLEKRLKEEGTGSSWPVAMSEANALTVKGILACSHLEFDQGRRFLREAVRKDPLLEEAWEALAKATDLILVQTVTEKRSRWNETLRIYSEGLSHDRGYLPHLLGRADAHFAIGEDRLSRGEDPLADFDLSERDWLDALRLGGQNTVGASRGLGDVRTARGVYRMSCGRDPLPDWRAAESDFGQALSLSRGRKTVFRRRGALRLERARYRVLLVQDPLPDLSAAEQDISEALRLDKGDETAWERIGWTRTLRGTVRAVLGEDPEPDFAAAERDFGEAIRIFSNFSTAWRNRGTLRLHRALYRLDHGLKIGQDLEQAEEDLNESLRRSQARWAYPSWLTSEFLPGWTVRGMVRMRRAGLRLDRHENASADLEGAAKDFEEALGFNPKDAEAFIGRAELHLLNGSERAGRGDRASALDEFQKAIRDFEETLHLNPLLKRRVDPALTAARARAAEFEK